MLLLAAGEATSLTGHLLLWCCHTTVAMLVCLRFSLFFLISQLRGAIRWRGSQLEMPLVLTFAAVAVPPL